MADKNRYPQIPSTVWWGVRSILQRTPNATVDERFLGVQLNVQEAAARAYINELRSVGILTEEGKGTPLANKWRLDETYPDAVEELIATVYPEGLVHLAPPGEAERQKVVSWFQKEGLGTGAAGNKAATYLLLSSPTPNEAARTGSKSSPNESNGKTRPSQKQANGGSKAVRSQPSPPLLKEEKAVSRPHRAGNETFPLNVNVQIHISADAGSEQIDSIFQAMRKYLYDAPNP